MARVCVGCGLTTDVDGLLIVNTVGAWPFTCDQEDFGGGVYCSPVDGALRTAPPVVARNASTSGGVSPADPITVTNGSTVTVDTIDVTLTNPSTCYSARALLVMEADVHFIIPEDSIATMSLSGNRYLRFPNKGDATLNTVSWQLTRAEARTLTPGQVLVLSIPIEVLAEGGNIEYTNVNWRASAIIVATQ